MTPPFNHAEQQIALLLGWTPEDITRGAHGGWRAAQIASWRVPVACCVRCHGPDIACAGLAERGTTHRVCWPEAFQTGNQRALSP